jgi:hypothetical protein
VAAEILFSRFYSEFLELKCPNRINEKKKSNWPLFKNCEFRFLGCIKKFRPYSPRISSIHSKFWVQMPRRPTPGQGRGQIAGTLIFVLEDTKSIKSPEEIDSLQREGLQIFRWEYLNPRIRATSRHGQHLNVNRRF